MTNLLDIKEVIEIASLCSIPSNSANTVFLKAFFLFKKAIL